MAEPTIHNAAGARALREAAAAPGPWLVHDSRIGFLLDDGAFQPLVTPYCGEYDSGERGDFQLMAASWDLAVSVEYHAERADQLARECERLAAWLARIDGGDAPCDDAAQLRRWAYEALTLGREVSDG